VNAFFSKFLESGLVAAAVMGVAYLLTFFNIAGTLDAVCLPHEFISIGIPQIIETIYRVVVNFWVILPFALVLAVVAQYLHNRELLRCVYSTAALLALIMFSVLVLGYFLSIDWILVVIIVYIWVKHLMRPLIMQRHVRGFHNKWLAHYEEKPEKAGVTPRDLAARVSMVCLIICGLYYTSQTMYEYGVQEVQEAEYHYVAHDYDDKVVVFESDLYYVLMSSDGDTLSRDYQIVRFDELGSMSYEYTGVLTVEGGSVTTHF
jgi:hypothetical protein